MTVPVPAWQGELGPESCRKWIARARRNMRKKGYAGHWGAADDLTSAATCISGTGHNDAMPAGKEKSRLARRILNAATDLKSQIEQGGLKDGPSNLLTWPAFAELNRAEQGNEKPPQAAPEGVQLGDVRQRQGASGKTQPGAIQSALAQC